MYNGLIVGRANFRVIEGRTGLSCSCATPLAVSNSEATKVSESPPRLLRPFVPYAEYPQRRFPIAEIYAA